MNDEPDSGVVKLGLFFSEYLEGIPNSKIFALSEAIYGALSSEYKQIFDAESTVLKPLKKEQIKDLHKALSKQDFNRVRDMVKDQVSKGEVKAAEGTSEVPEDVLITMKQDPDHDFAADEKVAVKRTDGRITFGFVYLIIDDKILISLPEGLKPTMREDIWHF